MTRWLAILGAVALLLAGIPAPSWAAAPQPAYVTGTNSAGQMARFSGQQSVTNGVLASADVDNLCSTNGDLLERIAGTWSCVAPSAIGLVNTFDSRTGAVTFGSSDLDNVCSTNGDLVERVSGTWSCVAPSAIGVTSFDSRLGAITFATGDLDNVCSTNGQVLYRVAGAWGCASPGTPTIPNPLYIPTLQFVGIATGSGAPSSSAPWPGSIDLAYGLAQFFVQQAPVSTPGVQQTAVYGGTGTTSFSATFGATPAVDDWEIAFVDARNGTPTAATGWTLLVDLGGSSPYGSNTRVFYHHVTPSDTATATPTGVAEFSLAIFDVAGLPNGWTAAYQALTNTNNAGGSSETVSATTTQPNTIALFYGMGGDLSTGHCTAAPTLTGVTGGLTTAWATNADQVAAANLLQASTGSVSATFTPGAGTCRWGNSVLLFLTGSTHLGASGWWPGGLLSEILSSGSVISANAYSLNFGTYFTVTDSSGQGDLAIGYNLTSALTTPPPIGGTTPAAGSFSSLKDTGAAASSGFACLHEDTSGNVSNAGADCGTGSGGAISLYGTYTATAASSIQITLPDTTAYDYKIVVRTSANTATGYVDLQACSTTPTCVSTSAYYTAYTGATSWRDGPGTSARIGQLGCTSCTLTSSLEMFFDASGISAGGLGQGQYNQMFGNAQLAGVSGNRVGAILLSASSGTATWHVDLYQISK